MIADYELRNQGTMDIEWAKAVFTASCTDATRYSTEAVILWGYEPDITTGQVKAGSVIIDTFAKEATAIEAMVSDYY
ncbi:MAG TPA: hypothetical protein VM223_08155 [Planctomycetota bacterium]|nr:hypothetical protein [Planctomycetota bacterium]